MANERSSIIISVFSTTPGIGKTVTAINLAAGLAKEGYGVCLVDLDLQFGDVLNYLKLSSEYTIAKAQRSMMTNPDDFHVKDFLINYHYGYLNFSIMPPPLYVYDAYQIDVPTIESIVKQLTYFDFVVLDLSSVFSSLNLAMLDISTVINFLGVIDFLPALKNFKIGYDTLIRFEYEESKIRLVENRADSQKLIDGNDVERLLGEPFYHRLPNDYPAVSKSINEGRPLMFAAPNSKLTASFSQLTGKYTNRQVSIPEIDKTKPGFFAKYFNGFFD
ncbi:MAG: AAA family ATPase [Selenomonadaceae bacterium]|nr:AAA family ATPase [Selenomonadaceae bacterium]